MSQTDEELIARAIAARDRAYAPYSTYMVGAAIAADGAVYEGANIENVSYGDTICAERAAMCAAVYAGAREFDVVVVVTQSSPPVAPCGTCRQAMLEFTSAPERVRVILANPQGERVDTTLAELLPRGFRKSDLDEAT